MTLLNSPQRKERRDVRYPLQLPVSVKLAHKEMRARSENISLGGILLSSAFLIPEGSAVEVAVGVANLPDPGTLLSARGKVLRVQPRPTGDFAVAIQLEQSFEVGLQGLNAGSGSQAKESPRLKGRNRAISSRSVNFALAWHTET
jgi:hypothetical protein